MPRKSILIDSGSCAKAMDASLANAKGKRANVVITARAINNVFMVPPAMLLGVVYKIATGMPINLKIKKYVFSVRCLFVAAMAAGHWQDFFGN